MKAICCRGSSTSSIALGGQALWHAEASRAAQDVADVIGEIMGAIPMPPDKERRSVLGRLLHRGGGGDPLIREGVPSELEARYLDQWEATIQAMRRDTAPTPDRGT
jgi:hypothetical protein